MKKVKAKDRSRTKNKVSPKAETASYKGNKHRNCRRS